MMASDEIRLSKLNHERDVLQTRISKLNAYIASPGVTTDKQEYMRLIRQELAMAVYLAVLEERIEALKSSSPPLSED